MNFSGHSLRIGDAEMLGTIGQRDLVGNCSQGMVGPVDRTEAQLMIEADGGGTVSRANEPWQRIARDLKGLKTAEPALARRPDDRRFWAFADAQIAIEALALENAIDLNSLAPEWWHMLDVTYAVAGRAKDGVAFHDGVQLDSVIGHHGEFLAGPASDAAFDGAVAIEEPVPDQFFQFCLRVLRVAGMSFLPFHASRSDRCIEFRVIDST